MTSLLIVDDEPKMSGVLARMLARDGYDVDWTDSPATALEKLNDRGFDIVLCDLRMPEMSGIDVLERAKRVNPAMDFVMMTAFATPQTAVESMKKGAIDYLIKPFAIEELKALIKRIEQSRTDREEETPSHHELKEYAGSLTATPTGSTPAVQNTGATPEALKGIVAGSTQMQDVLTRTRKVAASNASVLLRGESGTGKEVLARAIHSLSARKAAPLVIINCGAIPESLMESELFGHLKGSFTGANENRKGMFESANGGSIFLDEIGELPLHLQVKLLRVLQEGEVQRVGESVQHKVDVRVIAATNRNLEDAVARGEFRQDLYYRLNVIPITLPPLRERPGDLQPLIQHFLRRFTAAGSPKTLSPDAQALLMRYDYPGNIRELENAIEHAVVLSDGATIHVTDLPFQIQNFEWARGIGSAPAGSGATGEHMHLEEIEKRCILSALEKTRYNHTRAAAHLGITRRTLGYRIQKYGLEAQIDTAIDRLKESRN
ncbi:MAG: sigma-54-dependent transcriptional regulator [Candidatus Sumerlaeaceae bacterium]